MVQVINAYAFDDEFIESGDVVGGEINLSGLDLSIYDDLRVYYENIVANAADNSLSLQLVLGGSTISSGYRHRLASRTSAGTTDDINSTSASAIPLTPTAAGFGIGNDTGESASGILYLSNHSSSLIKLVQSVAIIGIPSGGSMHSRGLGSLDNGSNITGFRFFCPDGGGSLVSGRVTVVGIPKP